MASFSTDEFGVEEDSSGTRTDLNLNYMTYVGALGVRRDATGLLYARQRYYDSSLGRWLSADPIGFAGGLNLYTYVGQNPTSWVDPSGLDRVKFLSGKYKGYFGGGVQFNENYVNTKIRPNFEKKGHTFSLCQGVDRFGLINSLYDNDVVYVSTHGAINGNGIAGWDLGPNRTTDVVRSDDRDLPGSGGFGYSPFRAKLVIAGSCEVGQIDALAKSLGIDSKSNAAFVGWDRSIDAGVSDRAIQSLFDQLLQGKTIGEAVDSVGNPNLKLYGNSNVRLEP
ncbi:MAG: RHS repeat-associated core domain-containing protein [Vulcanimicrobiota bacterium]